MLGRLLASGYELTSQADEADVLVVNTCAFIDAAKEESVDAILDLAGQKQSGSQLVVTGCLSQRYGPDLQQEIPEIDLCLGTGNFETIVEALGKRRLPLLGDRPVIPDPDFTLTARSPRLITGSPHSRYIKVSEGCSNTCAFCIIPKLRGPQRSRTIADVVAEAEAALDGGAVELNLVAQDLCAFGRDRSPKESLADLLLSLDRTAAEARRPVWIRCLYAYPKGLTRRVMRAIAACEHVLPYLDMPLQHISDKLLRKMRRGTGGQATLELLRRLRAEIPGLILRTTFITGLPGETEDDFHQLEDAVRELCFERMGVFAYSREEDTPAAKMAGQVPASIAQARRDRLMVLQRQISRVHQQALVGQALDVLVEGVSDESEWLLRGRHWGQAPEIDGLTYITDGDARPGDVVSVLIDQAHDYDVAGAVMPRSSAVTAYKSTA
jgi:ribosomal protein S12 methylthiotransferase